MRGNVVRIEGGAGEGADVIGGLATGYESRRWYWFASGVYRLNTEHGGREPDRQDSLPSPARDRRRPAGQQHEQPGPRHDGRLATGHQHPQSVGASRWRIFTRITLPGAV